jgi:hypothetical protein
MSDPLLLYSPINHFQLSIMDGLLWPYQYLSISGLYQRYTNLIDLFIYVLIFIGAAQVTLGQRFPGNGGKTISIGTGLSLAVAMVILEERLGFSLKSFGPLAAGIVIFLLGIVIYRLLHQAGLEQHKAGAIAYLALFATLMAVTPELFRWLSSNIPILGLAVLLLLILSVFGAASAFWPGSGSSAFMAKLHRTQAGNPGASPRGKEFKKEAGVIKHNLRPIARKTVKDSEAILNDLEAVRGAIQKYGADPQTRRIIIQEIAKILPKQHELRNQIQYLKGLNEQILRLDASIFSKDQRQQISTLNAKQKTLFQAELRDQAQRMGIEQKIQRIEAAFDQYAANIDAYLRDATGFLQSGQIQESMRALENAVAAEQTTVKLARAAQNLETALLALSKRDIQIEKYIGRT